MAISYKVVKAPQSVEAAQSLLDQMGDENWELIQYTSALAIFKKTGQEPMPTG